MQIQTRYQDLRTRVNHGKSRERQIAMALRQQAGLVLKEATEDQDKTDKIDRWLVHGGREYALQIKYRETGDDVLFEVFYRWEDWNSPANKPGRDMQGSAELYACLKSDQSTVVIFKIDAAKDIIRQAVDLAQNHGWTHETAFSKSFRWNIHGHRVEIKVQKDPSDGRTKMMAYIPSGLFEAAEQAAVYRVSMPKNWK
jgi:hypothetical protein